MDRYFSTGKIFPRLKFRRDDEGRLRDTKANCMTNASESTCINAFAMPIGADDGTRSDDEREKKIPGDGISCRCSFAVNYYAPWVKICKALQTYAFQPQNMGKFVTAERFNCIKMRTYK